MNRCVLGRGRGRIEEALSLADLAQFTAPAPPKA